MVNLNKGHNGKTWTYLPIKCTLLPTKTFPSDTHDAREWFLWCGGGRGGEWDWEDKQGALTALIIFIFKYRLWGRRLLYYFPFFYIVLKTHIHKVPLHASSTSNHKYIFSLALIFHTARWSKFFICIFCIFQVQFIWVILYLILTQQMAV